MIYEDVLVCLFIFSPLMGNLVILLELLISLSPLSLSKKGSVPGFYVEFLAFL